ncbi:MAG: tRNA-dihydrouridine synthase A [Rhodospirillaceae bacterium]|nr:MAG: tRNA-dihydrouridine synthase A [Rhodospirillaceae bacterium]
MRAAGVPHASPDGGRQGVSLAARRICLAPMMDRTDRHFRRLMRCITRTALLYTEMIPALALVRGRQTCLLDYHPVERPLAVQFGGSDPDVLAECARMAADRGYDEINLNVGCPSERVADGGFGACLMARPDTVARCVEAMARVVTLPVTVKHRIGIDAMDSDADLTRFVATVAQGGCTVFIVHARKAWLGGVSPKQNRSLPPLDHAMVYRLKADRPDLTVVINGGIASLADAAIHLERVDGVMIGRAAYETPCLFVPVDRMFGGCFTAPPSPRHVAARMIDTLACTAADGTPPVRVLRHMHGLFHGMPGARRWRRCLTSLTGADPDTVVRALHDCLDSFPTRD